MQSYQYYKNEFNKCLELTGETGYVESVIPPIVYVNGLPGVRFGEVVYFETGEMGTVIALGSDNAEVLLYSRNPIVVGTQVARSGMPLKMPVGGEYIGHSIDPLGRSTSESVYIPRPTEYRILDRPAPGIDMREKITQSFETGVAVVDLMIPLGRGQRELVLGDRKTGKTEFLMQVLLTQAKQGSICIYTGIGKKKVDIKRAEEFVLRHDLTQNTIILSTSSTDPLGMIYITPYAAMTLAEYFRDQGRDVCIILDDLSTHAKFYREISLIGRRFPGRNSYPGDIFYAHSRLLERAGNFKTEHGIKSVTCLPVAETIESDISGYIQTNLMSITDGHVYFDHELFEQGRRPSVNYFLSVTRVGRQTQNKVRWGINRELSSFLTLYEKTQRFIHFGAELNEGIKSTLSMGTRILNFFDQPMGHTVGVNIQVFIFCLIWIGAIPEEDSARLQYITSKCTTLYDNNTEFNKLVNSLIGESTDFNLLLGRISSQSKQLMDIIDKG